VALAASAQPDQPGLFDRAPVLPEGMRHAAEFITADEERALIAAMQPLDFREFEFRGYLGKRRTVSFGWRYSFNDHRLSVAERVPDFLRPVRAAAAAFAGLTPEGFPHVLLTEYSPGSAIGWHRDRPEFGDVVGLSLGAPCRFRLRRRRGDGWERLTLPLAPRSIYLLRGPVRTEWEHSIPPVDACRYSITFRTLRDVPNPA
jgi:alkylated DNA repair dioxygenase AlkB